MFLQAKTLPDGSAHTHGIYKGVPPGVLNKAKTVPLINLYEHVLTKTKTARVCVSVVSLRVSIPCGLGSRFISRAAKTKNPVPRSFSVLPKPNGKACYAGYSVLGSISCECCA